MPSKAKDVKPLALANTLRDLALLRVSDIDISALLPPTSADDVLADGPVSDFVEKSYLFVQEARTAVKIHNRAVVAMQGGRVEDVRSKLDELAGGLY